MTLYNSPSVTVNFQHFKYMIKPFDLPPNFTLIKYMIRWFATLIGLCHTTILPKKIFSMDIHTYMDCTTTTTTKATTKKIQIKFTWIVDS